jgi:hypothetical protein
MVFFQTKNPKFGNILEGLVCSGKCRYILWPFGHFSGDLVSFPPLWCIFTVLVCCTEKNPASLVQTEQKPTMEEGKVFGQKSEKKLPQCNH